MNKNMTFEFGHPNLGNLITTISSGESINSTQSVVPATLTIKHKGDSKEFLFALYTMYAGKNDVLTNIIGRYLTDNSKLSLEVDEIAKQIDSIYANYVQKKSKKFNAEFKENDGISIKTTNKDTPDDTMYSADITIQKVNGKLSAYIDSQMTAEEFRNQGLMSKVLNEYLPAYCQRNKIATISLEVGVLDGVDVGTLSNIYKKQGFEKQGELFVKQVGREDYLY